MDKRRVLIVDDEAGFTRLLKLTLERTGRFIVWEQNDPVRAQETARLFRPDAVLLDVVMPHVDGGEIAARFKSDPLLRDCAIIFLTAIVGRGESAEIAQIDGTPYLAKPVGLDELTAVIDRELARVRPCSP
jgi:CheY-like chemotaxis protein